MAIVVPGSTRCPLCRKPLRAHDDVVRFCLFHSPEADVRLLSDAAAHYACLKDHPRRGELAAAFLGRLGADGLRPGGDRVVTVSPDTRAALAAPAGTVVLMHGPVFVELEMPAATAAAWRASDFWRCLEGAASAGFAGKGLAAEFRCRYGLGKVAFSQCPHGRLPAEAAPSAVRRSVRNVTAPEALRVMSELRAALAAAV